MSDSINTELEQLAQELKETCDESGRELDCAKSAEIIYRIGLAHSRERSDKISLIKSVGLLNAAIIRNPQNVSQIESDLSNLCKHILKEANAQEQTANLIEQAKYVKNLINDMRNKIYQMLIKPKRSVRKKVIKKLKSSKATNKQICSNQRNTIELIQKIQTIVTEDYRAIMTSICQFCTTVMGSPPCRFAVVGMGSISRNQITPYSDFEHVIILEEEERFENYLEYFRWFSAIFHAVVLNLQETRIPSLHILHLNDKESKFGDWFFDIQVSGVSFDGMMPHACKFPLGRQHHTDKKPWTTELIQPVDKMLEFLGSEANLKNGYHLSDILTSTCCVYGDEHGVYKTFENGVMRHEHSKTREETLLEIKQQVKEDLNKFSARFSLNKLQENDTFNVKQLFYRSSTLFVVALGKIHQIRSSSCFDIIKDLAEQGLISQYIKNKLLYAVAIACEIRLRVYMEKKSQYDYIQLRQRGEEDFDNLLEIVGKPAIFNYLQIVYCLQCEIICLLNMQKTYIYSTPQFVNIAICYALRLDGFLNSLLMKSLTSPYFGYKNLTVFNGRIGFDQALSLLEQQTTVIYEENADCQRLDIEQIFDVLWNLSMQLYHKKLYSEAVDFFKTVLDICNRQTPNKDALNAYVYTNSQKQKLVFLPIFISLGLFEMNEKEEALRYVKQFMEDMERSCHKFDDVSLWYYIAGNIFFKLKDFDSSLLCQQLSLGIFLSLGKQENETALKLLSGIASCLLHLKCYQESHIYFTATMFILEKGQIKFSDDVYFNSAFTLLSTHKNFGNCLMNLNQYKDALEQLLQAYVNITTTVAKKDKFVENLLSILHDIAECHLKLGSFEESFSYLGRSLLIRQYISQEPNAEKSVKQTIDNEEFKKMLVLSNFN